MFALARISYSLKNISSLVLLLAVFLLYPKSLNAPDKPNTLSQVLGSQILAPLGVPTSALVTPPLLNGSLNFNQISAKSFLVYDVSSKTKLAERNPDQPLAIASITKLMTALVTYNYVSDFRKVITVTPNDTFTVKPVLGLRPGDEVTLADLFNSMLVGSANDAALTLANHVEEETGQKFSILMNETAESLEMQNSHFSNPLGFDSEANYSTADDLRKLVQEIQGLQAFNLLGRNLSYNFSSANNRYFNIKATNVLLSGDKELYAIKTGHTQLAGGAMISEVKSGDKAFVIILLDSTNREQDTKLIKQIILSNYVWPTPS